MTADRALAALRTALLATAGACVALGILGAALALLAGQASPWPGLSLLLAGQVVALVAAGATLVALRKVRAGAEPRPVTTRLRELYGRLQSILLATLVAGVTIWVIVRPEAMLAVVACALVAVQLVVVLRFLRR